MEREERERNRTLSTRQRRGVGEREGNTHIEVPQVKERGGRERERGTLTTKRPR